jgi:hypothetical protein
MMHLMGATASMAFKAAAQKLTRPSRHILRAWKNWFVKLPLAGAENW